MVLLRQETKLETDVKTIDPVTANILEITPGPTQDFDKGCAPRPQ